MLNFSVIEDPDLQQATKINLWETIQNIYSMPVYTKGSTPNPIRNVPSILIIINFLKF